jgi:hypothetical protein
MGRGQNIKQDGLGWKETPTTKKGDDKAIMIHVHATWPSHAIAKE